MPNEGEVDRPCLEFMVLRKRIALGHTFGHDVEAESEVLERRVICPQPPLGAYFWFRCGVWACRHELYHDVDVCGWSVGTWPSWPDCPIRTPLGADRAERIEGVWYWMPKLEATERSTKHA